MRIKMVRAGGVNTRVLYEGSGPVLLLLHAFGGLAEHWIRNIDDLAERYTVVAPDMLSHGFTETTSYEGQPPYEKTIEHIVALLDALGVGNFAVCGSSFGGLIAGSLYFRLPGRVTHLVLCGSGSMFADEGSRAQALPVMLRNAMSAMSDPSYASCFKRLANLCYDPDSVPEAAVVANLHSIALPGIVDAYREAFEGVTDQVKSRPWRLLPRLEQVLAPTLVFWGLQDTRSPYDAAAANIERLPNRRVVTIDQCGHLPHLEHPTRFNHEVRNFVSQASAGK